MRVSFDLDDTLFVNPAAVATEKPLKFPFNLIYKERLRLGTVELLKKIRKNSIELWIYTTSFRSEMYIKSLFKCYRIKVDGVVNGERHQREVQGNKKEPMPSKYPSRYRIDLHVDDDLSVAQNGRIYGFNVYLLRGNDPDWHIKLWDEIDRQRSLLRNNIPAREEKQA